MATVDHDRQGQATHRCYKLHTRLLQVWAMHELCNGGSAHDFSVKLSPCVCIYIVAGEIAAICQHVCSPIASENYA